DTKWTTESYQNGNLGKAGVGIYVDANPGTTARAMRIDTDTPGFSAQVYASNRPPTQTWPDGNWHLIGNSDHVAHREDIRLSSGGQAYRYYLLWITNLGSNSQAAISELALYR